MKRTKAYQKVKRRVEACIKASIVETPVIHTGSSIADIQEGLSVENFFIKACKDKLELEPEIAFKLFSTLSYLYARRRDFGDVERTCEGFHNYIDTHPFSEKLAFDAYMRIGRLCQFALKYDIAEKYFLEALKLKGEIEENKGELEFEATLALVENYREAGLVQKALDTANELSLSYCSSKIIGYPAPHNYVQLFYLVSYIYRDLGKIDEAIYILQTFVLSVLNGFENKNKFVKHDIAETNIVLGRCFHTKLISQDSSKRNCSKGGNHANSRKELIAQIQKCYFDALEVYKEVEGVDSLRYGQTLRLVAAIYQYISLDEAFKMLCIVSEKHVIASLKILQKHKEAHCYLTEITGLVQTAFELYTHEYLSPFTRRHADFEIIIRKIEEDVNIRADIFPPSTLAKYFYALGKYYAWRVPEKSIDLLTKALEYEKQVIGENNLPHVAHLMGLLATAYEHNSQGNQSLECSILYMHYRELIAIEYIKRGQKDISNSSIWIHKIIREYELATDMGIKLARIAKHIQKHQENHEFIKKRIKHFRVIVETIKKHPLQEINLEELFPWSLRRNSLSFSTWRASPPSLSKSAHNFNIWVPSFRDPTIQ